MIRCQNSIVTVNVQSVHRQLQATTPASSRLIWDIFYTFVDQSMWQIAQITWSASLSLALVFGFDLSLRQVSNIAHQTW